MRWKDVTGELLTNLVKKSKCSTDILQKLKKHGNGRNYRKLKEKLYLYKIDTSHFLQKYSKNKLGKFLTKSRLSILTKRFGSVKDIAKHLNIFYSHYNVFIRNKIKSFGLKLNYEKAKRRWKKKEKIYILKNYAYEDRVKLIKKFPKRSWTAIKLIAQRKKIKRQVNESKKSDLSILLERTPKTYYWIGFLMADGHFTEKRIVLKLAKKDKKHLLKFGNFIKCKIKLKKTRKNKKLIAYGISAMDYKIVPLIRKRFSIVNNKTYNPCNISSIRNNDLFLSLFIGFFDGDGSVCQPSERIYYSLRIKCHSSWFDNLQLFSNRICKLVNISPNKSRINKQGYVEIAWSKSSLLIYLKNKIKELNLPVLQRKWGKINLKGLNHANGRKMSA